MKSLSQNRLGFALAIIAAVLWGLSGACAQFAFQQKNISIEWLVTVRLLIAGTLLLLYSTAKGNVSIWQIWKIKQSAIDLVLFGLFGMLAVQYTYFAAIKYSNAATGTVLQYLSPVLIALYLAISNRRLPSAAECISIALAFLGTLLLVTHGETDRIKISGWALFWGIGSAVALAFYTIQPGRLLKSNDSAILVGWGMVIGGIGFSWISKPWNLSGTWDIDSFMAAAFIIIFGTLVAFYFYLAAVKKIGPQKTSLLACAEPLSATFAAVLWLGIPFGLMDWIGSICILATIFILSKR
jgi:drug/metabolite transporter (DMT)-like permease